MTLPCLKLFGDSSVPLAKTSPWSLQNRGWGQLLLHSLTLIPWPVFLASSQFLYQVNSQIWNVLLPALTCQLFAVVKLCLTLCDPMDCSTSGFTVSLSFLKLMSIKSGMASNHLIPSPPSPLALNLSWNQGSFPVSQLFASGGQRVVWWHFSC